MFDQPGNGGAEAKPSEPRSQPREMVSKGMLTAPTMACLTAGPSPGHSGGHQGWIWSMWVSSRALCHTLPSPSCFSGAPLGWRGFAL